MTPPKREGREIIQQDATYFLHYSPHPICAISSNCCESATYPTESAYLPASFQLDFRDIPVALQPLEKLTFLSNL